MTKIYVNGVIVNNDYKEIYDFYGYENTSVNDVISQLPKDGSPVEVIISSGGGHVNAGSDIYAHLKAYEGHVTTKVYSLAASAASIIALAGDKVQIAPTGQIMIHNVSGGNEGDYHVMEKEAETLKAFNKAIANAYTIKTGKSEEEILEMMDKETWLSAKDAVEQGFADEILFNESRQLVASTTMTLSEEAVNKARMMMANKTNEVSVTKQDFEQFKNEILDIIKPKENKQEDLPIQEVKQEKTNKIKTGLFL